jgi:hypothetical protein
MFGAIVITVLFFTAAFLPALLFLLIAWLISIVFQVVGVILYPVIYQFIWLCKGIKYGDWRYEIFMELRRLIGRCDFSLDFILH